ncbi:hypothetical protein DEI99_008450 [Curtobacterium sp. MCLR17_036]|uniref:hypothetical protein n=1 Tax=Curtobacterium sp. MCLR17_036 TaxID=2175620 RepID=UPI000DA828C1|nr:hypothetical protein [Curtobacterium sp. MCLR17_036]WIE66551.1 hypothetical protein DEI99_008450 [Curtobacterium sp. MCLR17_036]
MLTTTDLTVGPRGRRFCSALLDQVLDADGRAAERLGQVRFWAEYHLARERGDAVSLFGAGTGPRPVPEPAPPVTEVAAAIDAAFATVTPSDVGVRHVLRALAETTASAMSWQEPDAADVVLADPALAPVVARLATAWAGLPAVRAVLDAPRGAPQWSTVFHGEHGRHPEHGQGPDAAARALGAWRTALDDEVAAVRPRDRRRPADAAVGGSWWSTPPDGLVTTTAAHGANGPVGLWAVEDDFGWERAAVAPVHTAPGARVLVVDDADDWAALCRRWSIDVSGTTRRHDWYHTTGRDGDWATPDWAGVAEEHDAVHLTVLCWLRAAGTAVPVGAGAASVIAGWTPGATVWLRDPQPVPGATEDWVFDDSDLGWHRA